MRNILYELFPSPPFQTDIVIEPSLKDAASTLLSRIHFTDKKLLLVCDGNTHAALGDRLMNELSAHRPQLLILPAQTHADQATVQLICNQTYDTIIAVGSGTINDICKYASYLDGKSYAVFPTALSMNGYLSANASITTQGIKESHKAHLPAGIFCDMEVIAAAPLRLIQSGLGDSICRPTAQADWLLSHLMLGTSYDPLPFELLKPYETELFAHADKLVRRDPPIIELLLKTLLVSGMGMTLAGGSYPASQGEHMIAHTMEMKHGTALPATYHGEQIGVTTLTMARMQQELLAHPLRLPPIPQWKQGLAEYLGAKQAAHIIKDGFKKYDGYNAIATKLAREDIRDPLRQVILSEACLRDVLVKANAPIEAAQLGWSEKDYNAAISHAAFTRDRFTFLDMYHRP